MYYSIISSFGFLLVTILVLFVPGWLFLNIFLNSKLTKFEIFVLSVPLSFSLSTLLILVFGKFGTAITKTNILLILASLLLIEFIIYKLKKPNGFLEEKKLSKTQLSLLLISIVLMVGIKAGFLINTIFPTATDLGHHMFWVEKIISSEKLTNYSKIKVIPKDLTQASTSSAEFSTPKPIADFIIGEHIVFVIISLLSGVSVVSAFPSLVLFVINIFTAFVLLILAFRLFDKFPQGKNSAILSFLFIGPLYAISGAQEKFVSGGVIGNIIGNLLILTILFFIFLSLAQKSKKSMFVAFLLVFTLIYTHHLSTFILVYTLVGIILTLIFSNFKKILKLLKTWFSLVFYTPTIIFTILFFSFLVFVYTPSYLNHDAISSATGAPSKSTRTGIELTQLKQMLGDARLSLAIAGFILVFVLFSKNNYFKNISKHLDSYPYFFSIYTKAVLIGWFGIILIMVMFPHLLKVNIISTRIATFLAFPSVLLAGFLLAWLNFSLTRAFPKKISVFLIVSLPLFIFSNGLLDSNNSLKSVPNTQQAIETFHTAEYLSKNMSEDMWILKDHNYITSDTWFKVFLATDYSNPLSRSYFKRYKSHPNREHCTLSMISNPNSQLSSDCFESLNIGPVVVNTSQDGQKFSDQSRFSKVYQNDDLSIYWKK